MPEPIQTPWRAIVISLGIVAAGLAWPFLSRYVGKLPGDIVVRRQGWTFAFPIVTCLLISLALSLLLWLVRR